MGASPRQSGAPSDGSLLNAKQLGYGDESTADDQPTFQPDEMWRPLRSSVRRPTRSVLLGAAGLIALQVVLRAYVLLGGWFLYDDFAFIGRAASQPLWSHDYLLSSWNGHVMPGAFLWVKVLHALWPLNYIPVAISDAIAGGLVGLIVYRLLTSLFGRRPAVLIPLAFFLFSTITLPAAAWWAAALNQIPGMAAIAGALLLQVRYHRYGRVRDGFLGALAMLMGLFFSEKVLLAFPVIFALSFFYFTGGSPLTRFRRCLRDHAPVWTAQGVIAAIYVVYYLVAVPTPVQGDARVEVTLQTMGTNLVGGILPAAWGGPYRWLRLGVGAVADPSSATIVITAVISALLVAWSVYRSHRAVFGWLVIALYWAANAFILGITRAAIVGPLIGREFRYSTDVALIMAIFGALACIPLAGTFAKGAPQRLMPRRERSGRGQPPATEGAIATAVTVAIVVTSALSTFQFDRAWRNDVTPRFVGTVAADVRGAQGPVTVANLALPEAASPSGTGVIAMASDVVGSLPNPPKVLMAGQSTSRLFVLDDSGHLRAVWVDGFKSKPGPEAGCGWRIAPDKEVRIPLDGKTVGWAWFARVGYIASMESEVTVTAGNTTTKVHLLPGLNQFYVMATGEVGEVTFSNLTYGMLCTDDVTVGFAKPVIGTKP